ncbi:MAG: adenylate/guanylate cyclase domain-containing protein [Verrucomicrobiales bacterium]|nr:adenylate/guanylate cyclase domain-containing protein [Verrucomicrobiae bacterium]MCP5554576.1 adenylate/guanylate cyclase domain-containing protein [Akkermansiaceae bacterium]HRX56645.1 adenylate/guanylate cyclase domain-containing protein [Verrucomicrobiales bacterium]
MSRTNDHFQDLLLQFSQENDAPQRKAIEKRVWEEFGASLTVMVLDMSGFTELSQRHGVVHYLSMVRRMQLTARPIIQDFLGRVIKFEADNCFAVFPDVVSAIRACIALNHAFDAANVVTEDELDIRISCGIDTGRILLIGDHDFFGNAVNRASKLGEDIAGTGEILVTQSALDAITGSVEFTWELMTLSISGIELPSARIVYHQSPRI